VSGKLRDNVVMVTATAVGADGDTTEVLGVGLIVGERDGTYFVVTANHLVHDDAMAPRAVRIRYRDDPTAWYPATPDPRANDRSLDVAVLRVRGPGGLNWVRDAMLGAADTKVGLSVAYVGRNGEWYVPSIEGRVSSINLGMGTILVEGLNVVAGSSGAPIASRKRFLAIHTRHDPINGVSHAVALSRVKDLIKSDWAQSNIAWTMDSDGLRPPGAELSIGGGITRNALLRSSLETVGSEFEGTPSSGWHAGAAARFPTGFGLFAQTELGAAVHGFDVEVSGAVTGGYRERYREVVTESSLLLTKPLPARDGIQFWPQGGLTIAMTGSNRVEVLSGNVLGRRDPDGLRRFVLGAALGAELSLPLGGYRLGLDGRATLDVFASRGDAAIDNPRTFGMVTGVRIWR